MATNHYNLTACAAMLLERLETSKLHWMHSDWLEDFGYSGAQVKRAALQLQRHDHPVLIDQRAEGRRRGVWMIALGPVRR